MSTLTSTQSTSTPPSLPSFAQTFSNINHTTPMVNLAKISITRDSHQPNDMDTLPPIQNVVQNDHPDSGHRLEHPADARRGKKRSLDHGDTPKRQKHNGDRPPLEPESDAKWASSTVKQEYTYSSPSPDTSQMEHDQLDASPPPRRPAKKRRVNAAQGPKSQPTGDRDSPDSPVVAAFTAPGSDQGALEQVRATLSIKQKQKEIIDQRRGSTAGLLQSTPPPPPPPSAASSRPGPPVRRQSSTSTNSAPGGSSSQQHASPQQQHAQPSSHCTQPHHFSPPHQSLPAPNNSFSNSRRRRGTMQMNGGHTISPESSHSLAPSSRLPPPILTPSASTPISHAFPQPPPPPSQTQVQSLVRTPAIAKSSTTRAAPPKPLTIAPHGHSRHLEPLVHSAPVIGGFGPVRVPELPPIPITPGGRKVSAGMVGPGVSGAASVAIAKSGGMRATGLGLGLARLSTTLGNVPPTPAYASLTPQQHPKVAPQDGKNGFLQLFENFYDSLADSRLLKQWLQEQLAKSNTLLEQLGKLEKERESSGVTLSQVEELIERRVAPMRNEVEGLRRRVGELEEMLYRERQRSGVARRESYPANPDPEEDKGTGRRASVRLSDVGGYVFPERRDDSGERDWERERERGSPAGSLHSSPSFDHHRLSTSAVRLESAPSHSHVHPVFPLPPPSSQHRPSPLGMERERGTWERRRVPSTSNSNTNPNINANGRHDADRDRDRDHALPSTPTPTPTRVPST